MQSDSIYEVHYDQRNNIDTIKEDVNQVFEETISLFPKVSKWIQPFNRDRKEIPLESISDNIKRMAVNHLVYLVYDVNNWDVIARIIICCLLIELRKVATISEDIYDVIEELTGYNAREIYKMEMDIYHRMENRLLHGLYNLSGPDLLNLMDYPGELEKVIDDGVDWLNAIMSRREFGFFFLEPLSPEDLSDIRLDTREVMEDLFESFHSIVNPQMINMIATACLLIVLKTNYLERLDEVRMEYLIYNFLASIMLTDIGGLRKLEINIAKRTGRRHFYHDGKFYMESPEFFLGARNRF